MYSKEWWREYRQKNKTKLQAYKRKYDQQRYKTHNKTENKRRMRWRAKNPHKTRAHQVLNYAVKRGIIKRKPCEVCGKKEKIHGHHNDYSKPLEVNWLCAEHHAQKRLKNNT